VAAGGRRRAVVAPDGIRLAGWREELAAAAEGAEGDGTAAILAAAAAPGCGAHLLVDCTASGSAAAWYRRLLAAGVGIVAANKRPFAGPGDELAALREEAAARRLPLRFGATVGAGLPIVSTIEALAGAGDAPTSIAGVLSGTLGELAERLRAGESASAAVAAAHAAGLTEPHPWDDLSGEDVRRKLVILARLAGARLEAHEVEVEPFLSGDGWAGLPLAELWRRLPRADEALAARQAEASARGERLRYLASWDGGGARVALAGVGPEHPAFALAGPDNQVAMRSRDYAARPLVVQGPGAGPAVTAGGVLADLLRAAAEMGG